MEKYVMIRRELWFCFNPSYPYGCDGYGDVFYVVRDVRTDCLLAKRKTASAFQKLVDKMRENNVQILDYRRRGIYPHEIG